MGKIQDDEVSMVNIYYVIKLLGSKAGATAEGILKCFLEHTMQQSRALWRKIKKKLNLGVIAKIFEYSDGRYWIAADPDTDVVIPPPSHSTHSSRCSTPERRSEDGSDMSLPAATPPPDVPDETSRPPKWLAEYLRLHVHSMRTERALQRCKILGGVKAHYAAKRRREEPRRRRPCRDAYSRQRRRRVTYLRSAMRVQRERRRLFVAKKRLRPGRCDHRGPCVVHERNHEAVIERLAKDVRGFVDVPRTLATETRQDVFNNDLKIDFTPKSTSQDVRCPPSSDAPSSSQTVDVREEKRSQNDTLGHTSKTNANSKSPSIRDRQENIHKFESLTVNPRPCTSNRDQKGANDSIGPSRSTTPKTPGGPKGTEIIRSLGMEGLVTVVNNPLKNLRKLKVFNKDGSRSDEGPERRISVRDVATETTGRGRRVEDSDDEDPIPNKRYRRA